MNKKISEKTMKVPGPNALSWIKRDNEVTAPYNKPFYYPLVVAGGKGAIVSDVDGFEYIDLNSGLGVLNVGQSNPKIVEVMYNKARNFIHYSYTDFRYREAILLGEKLNEILPAKYKYFFASGGTEANEAALKIARHSSKKQLFLGFIGSFHGRTFGTMSFTSTDPVQRNYFHPMVPGVTLVPYPYCYRCPFKLEYPKCEIWCIDFIEEWVLKKFVPPEEVAGFLFEPIAGESGYIVPPPEIFPKLKVLSEKYEFLLIADEIQVGCGRTGKFLSIEHWSIVPDIITLGKGIGGGLPLSVTGARKEIMDLPPGSHCTTTGGNPVSCATAIAYIDLLYENNLMQKATEKGSYILSRLKEMQKIYPIIGDVRGKGRAIAFELVKNRDTKEPIDNKDFVKKMLKKGVLMVTGGFGIRIMPPLIIEKKLIDIALERIE